MNYEKFTLEVLDLLRRHQLIGEDSPTALTLYMSNGWDLELKLEY